MTWVLPPLTQSTGGFYVELDITGAPDQPGPYEVQRTTGDGFNVPKASDWSTVGIVEGERPRFVDFPSSFGVYYYRVRAIPEGYVASAWLEHVACAPVIVTDDDNPIDEIPEVRSGVKKGADGTDPSRVIPTSPALATDSAGLPDLEDGDAVTFAYNSPPQWWGFGGKVWDSTLTSGSTTTRVVRLENVTSTSADVVAKLQQPSGSATNHTHQFPGSATPMTDVLDNQDSTGLTPANLPALNDSFTVRGTVRFTNSSAPPKPGQEPKNAWGNVTMRIYSFDAGLSAFTLRRQFIVSVDAVDPLTSEDRTFTYTINAPDLDGDTGDKVRLIVTAFEKFGAGDLSFSAWGHNTGGGDATAGISWATLTVTTVAATDATAGATVRFLLMEADDVA